MSDEEQERVVRVHVTFPPAAKVPSGAIARTRVLDVSRADAPATVVGERDEELAGGEEQLDTQVSVPAGLIEAGHMYSVFVHVDHDGSGEIRPGDHLSPASHPVLTRGAPDSADVPLITV